MKSLMSSEEILKVTSEQAFNFVKSGEWSQEQFEDWFSEKCGEVRSDAFNDADYYHATTSEE